MSITSINGFSAKGVHCGIKESKLDLGVIYCDKPCNAAAVYTKNTVQGAPLTVTKKHLENGLAQAIVINSGIANVATGEQGITDAYATSELAAKELGLSPEDIIVSSTGLIGESLPMDKIEKGLAGIKDHLTNDQSISQSILTTDTCIKEAHIPSEGFSIGGIAKGSGMIHPNMATMLAFIATDAALSASDLSHMLHIAVNQSFNMISVDMDMSTSDMVVIMSNGLAGEVDHSKFQETLNALCLDLAKKIALDGEGATKLLTAEVKNAKTDEDAKLFAKSIVSSNLVKCAAYGNDPNWGRIISSMGSCEIPFNQQLNLSINDISIMEEGKVTDFDGESLSASMKEKVHITVDLLEGSSNSTAYGCDMTEEYIKINAEYHT